MFKDFQWMNRFHYQKVRQFQSETRAIFSRVEKFEWIEMERELMTNERYELVNNL